MGDDIWPDDRNGVRTPMQWSPDRNAGFSTAAPDTFYAPVIADGVYGPARVSVEAQRQDPDSIWNAIKHMLDVRRTHRAFGWGNLEWLGEADSRIAAFVRRSANHAVAAVHNLADAGEPFEIPGQDAARIC